MIHSSCVFDFMFVIPLPPFCPSPTRCSSVVCSDPARLGPEPAASLPGLACPGWRDRPGLLAAVSPVPILTGLVLLVDTITDIHKGLISKVGSARGWFTIDIKKENEEEKEKNEVTGR